VLLVLPARLPLAPPPPLPPLVLPPPAPRPLVVLVPRLLPAPLRLAPRPVSLRLVHLGRLAARLGLG
jgi:hypothetical protein